MDGSTVVTHVVNGVILEDEIGRKVLGINGLQDSSNIFTSHQGIQSVSGEVGADSERNALNDGRRYSEEVEIEVGESPDANGRVTYNNNLKYPGCF